MFRFFGLYCWGFRSAGPADTTELLAKGGTVFLHIYLRLGLLVPAKISSSSIAHEASEL